MKWAPGIRAKVLLASSALLAIPWIGYAFVAEMERFLTEAQARMLADNARAAATLVQERALISLGDPRARRELAPLLSAPIVVDGRADDWEQQGVEARRHGAERLAEARGAWSPGSLAFGHAAGIHGYTFYALFDVDDDRVVYCASGTAVGCDHLRISLRRTGGQLQRYSVIAPRAGPVAAVADGGSEAIEGVWRERPGGYVVELALGATDLLQVAFAVADVDSAGGTAEAVMVTDERVAEERTRYDVTSDVAAMLEGISRANLRIWLVDSIGNVVMRTGSLRERNDDTLALSPAEDAPAPADPLATSTRLALAEIDEALGGGPALRTHEAGTARPLVHAASHPIQAGGETIGAVLVEQSSESIGRVRRLALERLLIATVAAFVCGALILVFYVSRLSNRLRRLRDEADRAIDSAGRIRELTAGSTSSDEIGDLSRSYSAVLKRLAQYTEYLEKLARRLNHELRTPVAVVRSSLDNLRSESLPASATVFVDRAETGLDRLAAILSRMTEATRLEDIMGRAEREVFDLNAVVAGCAEGYRLAYAPIDVRYRGPGREVRISGVPDLIAQMLDKLAENAAEHAAAETPIEITLDVHGEGIVLTVRNEGPPLPADMEGRLFDSMVSGRSAAASNVPHLGLGLYMVKLIAQFHRGEASARNRSDAPGVEFSVRLAGAA